MQVRVQLTSSQVMISRSSSCATFPSSWNSSIRQSIMLINALTRLESVVGDSSCTHAHTHTHNQSQRNTYIRYVSCIWTKEHQGYHHNTFYKSNMRESHLHNDWKWTGVCEQLRSQGWVLQPIRTSQLISWYKNYWRMANMLSSQAKPWQWSETLVDSKQNLQNKQLCMFINDVSSAIKPGQVQ